MGDDLPAISCSSDGSPNKGKLESSKSESSSVESTYTLARPPTSTLLWCHENRRSLSLSDFRGITLPKLLGVPTGVISVEDTRSRLLGVGEWCKGGGDSRESSFTVSSLCVGRYRRCSGCQWNYDDACDAMTCGCPVTCMVSSSSTSITAVDGCRCLVLYTTLNVLGAVSGALIWQQWYMYNENDIYDEPTLQTDTLA